MLRSTILSPGRLRAPFRIEANPKSLIRIPDRRQHTGQSLSFTWDLTYDHTNQPAPISNSRRGPAHLSQQDSWKHSCCLCTCLTGHDFTAANEYPCPAIRILTVEFSWWPVLTCVLLTSNSGSIKVLYELLTRAATVA